MARFLISRLIQSVLVLFLVYTGTFWLLMAAPGDPFIGERDPGPAVRSAIAQRYGLDFIGKSAEERKLIPASERFSGTMRAYLLYAGKLFTGNAPTIKYENWTVHEVIASSLPVSLALGSLALVIALWGGVFLGTIGAILKGRWSDVGLTIFSLFGVSLPAFVIGTVLLIFFGVIVPIFPTGGWGRISQLILPSITLAAFFMAYIARLTRVGVLDVISADYVRAARAKGLSQRSVIGKHVLANASLPVLSYLGPAAATVLTGSFVVEKLFNIPGLGTHFVNSCLNTDIPLVIGAVMVYTVIVVVFNLLVDVAYVFVDPRIALK
jgi:oligopeptide transport system permease protein